MRRLSLIACAFLLGSLAAGAQTYPHVTGTFKTPANQTPSAAGLQSMATIGGTLVYGSIDFEPFDSAGNRPIRILCSGITYLPQPARAWIRGDGAMVANDGVTVGVDLVPTIGCQPAGTVYRATARVNGTADGRLSSVVWVEDKAIPSQATVDWGSLAPASITTPAVAYQLQANAAVSGYEDWGATPAPPNPAASTGRVFFNSATGKFECKDSTGASCMAAGGGGGYSTVQEEGTALTQRLALNFIGAAITAADDAANSRTNVTLSQSPAASASVVGIGRLLSTSAPLSGGGDLSADRTLACATCEVTGNKNAASGYAGLDASALVPVTRGGTDLASIPVNQLIVGRGASAPASLASGVSGQILTSQGAGADPAFADPLVSNNQTTAATAAWTSATALNTRLNLTVANYSTVAVSFNVSGTITGGAITFEVSDDGGTTWYPSFIVRSDASGAEGAYTLTGANRLWQMDAAAFTTFSVRLSTVITGAGTANVRVQAQAGTSDRTLAVFPAPSSTWDVSDRAGRVLGRAFLRNPGDTANMGDATTPVRTDPTGATTQPVSGTVTANAGTGNFNDASVGSTGSAVPSSATYAGGKGSGNLTGITVCDNWTPFSLTANGQIITGAASKQTYICSIDLLTATAQNIALVEGTGTTCGTGTAGMAGGSTAATGWNFAANGGLAQGSGFGAIMRTATAADNVCLLLSGTGQTSGAVSWTQY